MAQILQLASNVAAGLQDPLRPSFCPVCLVFFFAGSMEPQTSAANRRFLRLRHHDLWNAIIRWMLATSRADTQLAVKHQLKSQARSCTQSLPARLQEHRRLAREDNLLHTVIRTLCASLHWCFQESLERLTSQQRFSQHGLWPTSADDLLPTGAGPWLHSMSHWLSNVTSAVVGLVFEEIFLICRSEIQPLFLDTEHLGTLLGAISAHLDAATHDARQGGSVNLPAELDKPASRIAASAHLLEKITSAAEPAYLFCFNRGARKLLDSVQPALEAVADEAVKRRLALVAVRLYDLPGSGIEACSLHPYVREFMDALNEDLPDGFKMFYGVLRNIAERRSCSGPNCGRHAHDLTKLRTCANCGVFHYCGPACQKEHWKASHRTTCHSLRELFDALQLRFSLDLSEGAFVAACRSTPLDLLDLSRVYAVLVEQRTINQHLGAMDADVMAEVFLSQHLAVSTGQGSIIVDLMRDIAKSIDVEPTSLPS